MTVVALKGLFARRLRAALTALAIVLGVAMVSGSFVLTDTISKAFDSIFTSSYSHTDAVVSGRKLVDYSNGGNATVSRALLDRIRRMPDVAAASGALVDLNGDSTHATLLARGKAIQTNGNPTFGFGIDPSQARFNPLKLKDGRWATGPNEVVIDAQTAKKHHFAVGDTIGVAAHGPRRSFRIVGTATYGNVESLGGATIAVFSIPTAQRLLDLHGYSEISVAAKPGVSDGKLVSELKQNVPQTAQVRTATQQANEDKKGVSSFISFIRGFLLGFGGIALFVGAFVIFNTLSITVAQRTRELATLRTLGASRRQVLRSVVLESFFIGLGASVIGLFAGFGLARGLSSLFGALGLSLPEASTVYAARTVVISLLLGVLATVLAGFVPALRATRVPPIAAVREGAVIERRKRLGPVAGLVLFGIASALIAYATLGGHLGSGRSLLALAGGTLLGLLGVAGFAPALVTTLAAVVGIPAKRLGGAAGRLAAENATRNPARTASTAAALMIGLALVSFVAVLGNGVHGSIDRAIEGQVTADWVVTSQNGWTAFPAAAGRTAAKAPGVALASDIRSDRGRIGGANVSVNGVDPATIARVYHFDWKQGSNATLARLDGHGALVKQSFGRKHHLAVGDTFTLRSPAGTPVQLTVAGIFQPPRVMEVLGGVVISQAAFDHTFTRPSNSLTLIEGSPTQAGLDKALAAFPDAKAQTEHEYVKAQSSFIDTMLNLLYVLLALSVIVSLFGMLNTLVLSVFERTRELGMLRAVGMTRRQARRMVRHESVITALIGATLGLPLGIMLAAAVTHALGKYGVTFSVPVASLVVFAVAAMIAGVLAAIAPARRAARLNVLEALQYE
ncbi:MAG: ABC transporter permease [Gaiellaceae bacterium]